MKHYQVIYYTGREKKGLFVRAKSINDAIRQGVQLLRQHNVIGATVLAAERISKIDYLNGLDASVLQLKHRQIGNDRLMNAYSSMVETCIAEKESRARRSKASIRSWRQFAKSNGKRRQPLSKPLKANTIVNIIKKG